jgi:membrane-bound lytic murein transglycosylase B
MRVQLRIQNFFFRFRLHIIFWGICLLLIANIGYLPALNNEPVSNCNNYFAEAILDTNNWTVDYNSIFLSGGKPANEYVKKLVQELEKEKGPGQPVMCHEFTAIIHDLTDIGTYARQLLKYATPISRKIQDKAHYEYSKKLMSEDRLKAGLCFLIEHEATLKAAEKKFGVHPKDIVGILMWESALGKYTGDYRLFNVFMGQILYLMRAEKLALAELAAKGQNFQYSKRSQKKRLEKIMKNAVKNLAALLRVSKAVNANPLEQFGSWGGAIGYAQFMPASLVFAIDANRDGKINLYSWPDAIFSVANYLKKSGYRKSWRARRRAIFAYNRLDSYVRGVINYADLIWRRFEANGGYDS